MPNLPPLEAAMNRTGTSLADILFGTNDADYIFGLGGNDVLEGRAGPDILIGGNGNDRINSGRDDDPTPAKTALGFVGENYGGPGRDIIDLADHEDYGNGDGNGDGNPNNDEKFGDFFFIHQGGPPRPNDDRAATLINKHDVRGRGTDNTVQDRFVLASDGDYEIDSFVFRTPRADPDGSGKVASLRSVTILGEFGELVEFRMEDRYGLPQLHYEGSPAAELLAMVEGWELA